LNGNTKDTSLHGMLVALGITGTIAAVAIIFAYGASDEYLLSDGLQAFPAVPSKDANKQVPTLDTVQIQKPEPGTDTGLSSVQDSSSDIPQVPSQLEVEGITSEAELQDDVPQESSTPPSTEVNTNLQPVAFVPDTTSDDAPKGNDEINTLPNAKPSSSEQPAQSDGTNSEVKDDPESSDRDKADKDRHDADKADDGKDKGHEKKDKKHKDHEGKKGKKHK
jgi:hypothetical protein